MDIFMVIFTVIFLVFLASAFYLTVLQELHKRSKGIPIEYDSVQDLEKVLKDRLSCSFLQGIELEEKDKINFNCKYGTHTGVIKDGKFYIDKSLRKFSGHRDVEEAWYLEKHIKGIFEQNQEDKENLETKFAKYIKVFNISRLIKYMVYVCILLFVFRYIGGMEFVESKGVSKMQFTEYSDEITIGEALRTACPEGKWSSDKIDKGLYRVAFNGYGMNGRLLTIVFQSKDWSECSILSVAIDGQDCSLLEGVLLEALFENAGNGDSGGQIDEQGLLEVANEYVEEEHFATDGMEETVEDNVDLSRQSDETVDDSEMDQTAGDEEYDSEMQGAMEDSIPAWELSGHYGGIIGGQSVMDISMYSEDTGNGSVGYADIYVEGGEYSYQAELYEASTNLYWVAADTDEEGALLAYRDGTDIIVQLYVDGECITEYLLVGQFQS